MYLHPSKRRRGLVSPDGDQGSRLGVCAEFSGQPSGGFAPLTLERFGAWRRRLDCCTARYRCRAGIYGCTCFLRAVSRAAWRGIKPRAGNTSESVGFQLGEIPPRTGGALGGCGAGGGVRDVAPVRMVARRARGKGPGRRDRLHQIVTFRGVFLHRGEAPREAEGL